MPASPLVVFVYDFPHQKSYEGLMWLHAHGIRPAFVLAAPHQKLNIRDSQIRVGPSGLTFPTARFALSGLNFPCTYVVGGHNSPEMVAVLRALKPRLGLILGARILSAEVIEQFSVGIINAHPGLIPENRGLDNIKWAILDGIPQGVTTHLIGRESRDVDLGRLIERREVPVLPDDTLLDLQQRNLNVQYQMMVDAIARVEAGETEFPAFSERGRYRGTVPPEQESMLAEAFDGYRGLCCAGKPGAHYADCPWGGS